MSFHPLMSYDERFHKSERKVVDEGPPFTFTSERRAGRGYGDARVCAHSMNPIPGDAA